MSLAIFGLAQCAYSFLFVASYGLHLSNRGKCLAFCAALPFSQLVPTFTLVESMHTEGVSRLLSAVGLRESAFVASEASSTHAQADSMWIMLQRKYHAHAGFLLEALVEAIPQCALQLCFVVVTRQVSYVIRVGDSGGWVGGYVGVRGCGVI